MEKIVKNLGGHSGCKIFLMQNDNNYFVRKVSSGIDYNDRLNKQAEKQKDFKNQGVRAPEVFDVGMKEDGLAYFDMEYIQGITLAKGISTQNISQLNDIVDRIIGLFDIKEGSKLSYSNNAIFQNKIEGLEVALEHVERKNIKETISFLKKVDWSAVEYGSCHGDLTFENIIICNGQLYLIDFLDSFYDSWMLDASTLLQDSFMMWSYKDRPSKDTNLLIKLMVFKDLLEKKLYAMSPDYIKQIRGLLLLKLLRIYPYAKGENVKDFLDDATGRLLKLL